MSIRLQLEQLAATAQTDRDRILVDVLWKMVDHSMKDLISGAGIDAPKDQPAAPASEPPAAPAAADPEVPAAEQ